jgi:hypothetical protein
LSRPHRIDHDAKEPRLDFATLSSKLTVPSYFLVHHLLRSITSSVPIPAGYTRIQSTWGIVG